MYTVYQVRKFYFDYLVLYTCICCLLYGVRKHVYLLRYQEIYLNCKVVYI